MNAKFKAVILAAGEGTRMKSKTTKVLHKILGKTIINYITDAVKAAGTEEIIVVAGANMEALEANIKGATFALQAERLGTGHAVMCAKEHFCDDDLVLVLAGDGPLIRADMIKGLIESHEKSGSAATVVSTIFENPAGYGRIIRENGEFLKIVEHKDANEEERKVCEINTGIFCFKGKALKMALSMLKNGNSQNEYYLTDTLEIIKNQGESVNVFNGENPLDFYAMNDKFQLSEVSKIMKQRINKAHMINGVIIEDIDNTYIGPDVEIGMDTLIRPNTIIEGKCKIGSFCEIGPSSKIIDSNIGDESSVICSVTDSAFVGNRVKVGPFAYLRPKAMLCDDVKVGDFVEVKNAVLNKGAKASHLAYIGDAELGENVNFGCGAITANYDGVNKFRTSIGKDSFVGSNVTFVAPVNIGEGSFIAAGSTITEEVPVETLAFARARQVNKEGRAKNMGKKK